MQEGEEEEENGTLPAWIEIVTWDRVPHEREAMVHPRDRQEISSKQFVCVPYVCIVLLRGAGYEALGTVGRGEDENGTVMAKGRGWMTLNDPRAIRVTVAVDRHEK